MAETKFEKFKENCDESSVWFHFLRATNGLSARCNVCKKELKTTCGSTSGLHIHLQTKHNLNLRKRNADIVRAPTTYTPKRTKSDSHTPIITSLLLSNRDDSLPAILARMTAADGLPFSVFCTSQDLRLSLTARGIRDLPKSSNTIRKMVSAYARKVRSSVSSDMTTLKVNIIKVFKKHNGHDFCL